VDASGADVSGGIHGNLRTKEKEGKRVGTFRVYPTYVPVDLASCQNSGSEPRNDWIRWEWAEFEFKRHRDKKGVCIRK
jgi:hypothetical protein